MNSDEDVDGLDEKTEAEDFTLPHDEYVNFSDFDVLLNFPADNFVEGECVGVEELEGKKMYLLMN